MYTASHNTKVEGGESSNNISEEWKTKKGDINMDEESYGKLWIPCRILQAKMKDRTLQVEGNIQ